MAQIPHAARWQAWERFKISLAYDSFSRLALNDNRLDARYLDDALWIAFRAGWVSASAKASAAP